MKSASKPRVPFGPRLQLFAVLAMLTAISLMLLWTQIINGPQLAEQGRMVRTHTVNIPAERGAIVDANGVVLAQSVGTYHIAVNQQHIARAVVCDHPEAESEEERGCNGVGPAAAAKKLAPILQMDPVELGGLMVGDSTYRYLKKDVSPQVWRQVRALSIYGIEWEASSERDYPNGSIAAPIIGSLNSDGQGISGLEQSQEKIIAGQNGEESFEVGTAGQVMPGGKDVITPKRDGSTVHTTLRLDLQYAVEQSVNAAVKKFQADWGVAAVQEIATGRILALADSGNTEIGHQPQVVKAVQYAVEPGSVGKVITMATALEKGAITPESVFTVPYRYTAPNGQSFIDSHGHETYQRTATGILAESSNTGTVQIGDKVTDAERYQTMQRLGLGKPTGVPLAGESSGILTSPDKWDGRQRYTTMFGQGYAITQLQEVGLMAAIGNSGVYLPPRLIDGWTAPDGTYKANPPAQPVQALKPEVAKMLLTMMESTTSDAEGTGVGYAVEGYRISSKTGTAELMENGMVTGTATTVAGVVPSDKPVVAISVLLYRPRIGPVSTQSAGPLFHDVVNDAIHNLGIPASTEPAKLYPTQP